MMMHKVAPLKYRYQANMMVQPTSVQVWCMTSSWAYKEKNAVDARFEVIGVHTYFKNKFVLNSIVEREISSCICIIPYNQEEIYICS
jgi:hypothetical protein